MKKQNLKSSDNYGCRKRLKIGLFSKNRLTALPANVTSDVGQRPTPLTGCIFFATWFWAILGFSASDNFTRILVLKLRPKIGEDLVKLSFFDSLMIFSSRKMISRNIKIIRHLLKLLCSSQKNLFAFCAVLQIF